MATPEICTMKFVNTKMSCLLWSLRSDSLVSRVVSLAQDLFLQDVEL
jgi:hypothetical protein